MEKFEVVFVAINYVLIVIGLGLLTAIISAEYSYWKRSKEISKKQMNIDIGGFWKFFISRHIQLQEFRVFFDKFFGKAKTSNGHVWHMGIDRSERKEKYKLSIHIDKEIFGGSIFVSPKVYYKVSSQYQTKVKVKYIVGKFKNGGLNKIYVKNIKILEKLPPCVKDSQ